MNVFSETASVTATAGTPGPRPDEVLVAVPALNEATHIEACLDSLIGNDPFMAGVRVVVADGGSNDATLAIVQRLATRYPNLSGIDNPGRLQSAAVNGVVAAVVDPVHRYLVRCDAHAVYPPGYVRAVVESLAGRPEAASVATAMDATGTGCLARASAWIVDTPLGSGGSAHRGGHRSGWVDHAHHAGFRLDWFRRVGGYDPDFSHNEDAELDHRLGLAGGRVWLDAGIRLDYRMRETLRGLFVQYWRYGRGRARNLLKHGVRPRLRQMLPVVLVLVLAAGLLLGPFWPPALVVVVGYLAAVTAVSVAGMLALKSLCGLWAGPAMAAMHLAWGAGVLAQLLAGRAGRG